MKKPIIAVAMGLVLLPAVLTAQETRPAPGDRGSNGQRPGGPSVVRPSGPGGPQVQPPRPDRPQIQPARPDRPQIQPPRPGTGGPQIQPPRPGGGHVRPPRPERPRPPGADRPGHGHRPGYGRPPSHHVKPIHGDRYRYPRGYNYRRWTIGLLLPSVFLSSAYYYDHYANFGLPRPPAGTRWVRNGPDLVLIELRTRRIRDVIYGAFY